jgi:hypothetical protein
MENIKNKLKFWCNYYFVADLATRGKSPVILSRLTIIFKDNDFLPLFNNSQNAKKFDIVAIVPESAVALQNLLKSAFRDLLHKKLFGH